MADMSIDPVAARTPSYGGYTYGARSRYQPEPSPYAAPAPEARQGIAPSAVSWKSPTGVSPWQAWNRQDPTGRPSYAEWMRPGSAGNGNSLYQQWNRTGNYRTRTGPNNTTGRPTATGTFTTMDPRMEAQTQADLIRQERQRALNTYISGQRAQLGAQLDPAYEAVNQAMADRGIYNSTGAGTALAKTYNQIAAPIYNNIANAQADYADFGKNLGTQEAALYSQLARQGRDEFRQDRAFNTGNEQWNKQFASDIYNTLYAGALGRGQIQQDFNGIDFPSIPSWMTAYLRYAQPSQGSGPTGDPIEQGHGPIGDAGEKPGTKPGFTQYKIKSYARERAGVDDAYRNSALALQKAQEDRISKAQAWQQSMAQKQLDQQSQSNEGEFISQLSDMAWANGGRGNTIERLQAFAQANGRNLDKYLGLLSPHLRDQIRQGMALKAGEPVATSTGQMFGPPAPSSENAFMQGFHFNPTWVNEPDVGLGQYAAKGVATGAGEVAGAVAKLLQWLWSGK